MIVESQKPKYRAIVRVIAIIVAIVQAWTQVCFSANFSFVPRLKEFNKDRQESGYFSLNQLEKRERRQEKVIKQQREIQKFRERRERVERVERLEKAIFEGTLDRVTAIGSIREQVLESHRRVLEVASQKSEFKYIKYDDGRTVYFKDGLASRIENEKVPDAFGYESIRRVYNMTYNKKWLLESYEAETVDQFGKLTREHWQAEGYTEDSVFYATDETNADQFLTNWTVTITDPYDSILTVKYSDAQYTGKHLTSYHKEITDCCGHITNIEWSCNAEDYDSNKNLTKYHEEITDPFDNFTVRDWTGTYDEERLTSSEEESWTTNVDGSESYTMSETYYTYDSEQKLTGASGTTRTEGEDAFGNTFIDEAELRHEILNGHLELTGITGTTRYNNVDGSFSESQYTIEYQFDDKNFLVAASGETTTTGEDIFGTIFNSHTTDTYIIIGGQAKRKTSLTDTETVNFDSSQTLTQTTVEYEYDLSGYLIDARSFSKTTGVDVFGNRYETHSHDIYAIINGEARVISSTSIIDSYDAGWLAEGSSGSGDIQSIIDEIEQFLNTFIDSTSQDKKGILSSLGIGDFPLIELTTAGISTIIEWLRDSGTKILNCAVNALYNILTNLGIEVTTGETASKTILIDILTGTLTPGSASGELMTSMFAMVKEASLKGVNLSGAHLSLEQLQSLSTPVIAHIDGNHYVVVERISEGKVFLSGINGESMISIEDFSSRWNGDVLMTAVPSSGALLSEHRMKEIRGATGSDTDDDPEFDDKTWLKYFRKIEEGNITYIYYYNVEGDERTGGYNWTGIIQYVKVVRNSDGNIVSVHRESYNRDGVLMELLDVEKDASGNVTRASRQYHSMGSRITLKLTPNGDGSQNLRAIFTSSNGMVTKILAIPKRISGHSVVSSDDPRARDSDIDVRYMLQIVNLEDAGIDNGDGTYTQYGIPSWDHWGVTVYWQEAESSPGYGYHSNGNGRWVRVVRRDINGEEDGVDYWDSLTNSEKASIWQQVYSANKNEEGQENTISAQIFKRDNDGDIVPLYEEDSQGNPTGEQRYFGKGVTYTVDSQGRRIYELKDINGNVIATVTQEVSDFAEAWENEQNANVSWSGYPWGSGVTITLANSQGETINGGSLPEGDWDRIYDAIYRIGANEAFTARVKLENGSEVTARWDGSKITINGTPLWSSGYSDEDKKKIESAILAKDIVCKVNLGTSDEPYVYVARNGKGKIQVWDKYGNSRSVTDGDKQEKIEDSVFRKKEGEIGTAHLSIVLKSNYVRDDNDINGDVDREQQLSLARNIHTWTALPDVAGIELEDNMDLSFLNEGEVFGINNGFSGGIVEASPAGISGAAEAIFTPGIDLNPPVTQEVIDGVIDKFTGIVDNLSSQARGFFDKVTGGLEKVVSWLRGKGEYIISCGVYALSRILESKEVTSSREELAAETIFTDLINQVITSDSEEKVQTSAYALETAAKKRGLDLKTVKTDLENLSWIDSPVIAHVGGNHFVVVSKVEDGKVIGIEATGEEFAIPEEEFASQWDGIIIAARSPPQGEIVSTPPKIAPDTAPTEGSYIDENGNRVIEVTVYDEWNNPIKVTKTINAPDGSTSRTQTWTNYGYDNNGILISASGKSVTIGEDIFGNTYTTDTRNFYTIINGEAKVNRSVSTTNSSNIDGSTSVTEGEVLYEYDPTSGLLSQASGKKETEGNDIFGNRYLTATDDTYTVIKGEAKLVYSESETETWNFDDSYSKTTNWMRYEYTTGDEQPSQLPSNYSQEGKVIEGLCKGASSESHTEGEDIFGNTFSEDVITSYKSLINGQPKATNLFTRTTNIGIDGSTSQTVSSLNYIYDENTGNLRGVEIDGGEVEASITLADRSQWSHRARGRVVTVGADIFGNRYYTETINKYSQETIKLTGQPKGEETISINVTMNIDGSTSTTDSRVFYEYTNGQEREEALPDKIVNKESYINPDTGLAYVGLLKGVADGSVLDKFDIDGDGDTDDSGEKNPTGAYTLARDIFANQSESLTHTEYIIIDGQAKESLAKTVSYGRNVDGSLTYTIRELSYSYSEKGQLEVIENVAVGEGSVKLNGIEVSYIGEDNETVSVGVDNFGNYYVGKTETHYLHPQEWKGKVLMEWSLTRTEATNLDGSKSHTVSYLHYNYNPENGLLNEDNPVDNIDPRTSESFVLNAEVLVAGNIYSHTVDIRRNPNVDTLTVGGDIFGNSYCTKLENNYGNIFGQVKLILSNSLTETLNADGSEAKTKSALIYEYTNGQERNLTGTQIGEKDIDLILGSRGLQFRRSPMSVQSPVGPAPYKGLLKAVTQCRVILTDYAGIERKFVGELTVGKDLFGNTFYTEVENQYTILKSQARVLRTCKVTESVSIDGSHSKSVGMTGYQYYSNGRLKRAFDEYVYVLINKSNGEFLKQVDNEYKANNKERVISGRGTITVGRDFFGNYYDSLTQNEYLDPEEWGGKVKIDWVETITNSTNIDDSRSQTVNYLHYNYHPKTGLLKENDPVDNIDPSTGKPHQLSARILVNGLAASRTVDVTTGEKVNSLTVGCDVFGNKYWTETENIYRYDADGGIKVDTTSSLTCWTGIEGSEENTWSSLKYEYTDGRDTTLELRDTNYVEKDRNGKPTGIRAQFLDKNGNIYKGLLKGVTVLEVDGSIDWDGDGTFWNVKRKLQGTYTQGRDVLGNTYRSLVKNKYIVVVNGQIKVSDATTVSNGTNLDGSSTWSKTRVGYTYDGDKGRLSKVENLVVEAGSVILNGITVEYRDGKRGVTIGVDSFTNHYVSYVENKYLNPKYYKGKALIDESLTTTEATNIDGSKTWTVNRLGYTYSTRTTRLEIVTNLNIDSGEVTLNGVKVVYGGFTGKVLTVGVDSYGNYYISLVDNQYLDPEEWGGKVKPGVVTTTTDVFNIDGSRSQTKTSVNYHYHPVTFVLERVTIPSTKLKVALTGSSRLQSASYEGNGSVTVGADIFGNTYYSQTANSYGQIINGQAKITNAFTTTENHNIDGSLSQTVSSIDYGYDEKTGLLQWSRLSSGRVSARIILKDGTVCEHNASGRVVTVGGDFFGNKYWSESLNEYRIIKGEAKLDKVITATSSINIDGSTSKTVEGCEEVLEYSYDNNTTRLTGITNVRDGIVLNNDGFGNKTITTTHKEFAPTDTGQIKLSTSSSWTETNKDYGATTLDGTEIETTQASVVTYSYGEKNGYKDSLSEVTATDSIVKTRGYFGGVTWTTSSYEYGVINGQAKIVSTKTSTVTRNMDGSTSKTIEGCEEVLKYSYDNNTGRLSGITNTQDSIVLNNDGFGNKTITTTHKEFAPAWSGQIRLKTSSSWTETNEDYGATALDGTEIKSIQASIVTYSYGRRNSYWDLLNQVTASDSVVETTDYWGNVTRTTTSYDYRVIMGQAKVDKVTTYTEIDNIDGSHTIAGHKEWTSQASIVHYIYDNRTGRLEGTGAKEDQAGIILIVDAFGNVTKTETEKTYRLIQGQVKVDTVTTHTEIKNIDGSQTIASHEDWTSQASKVRYIYNETTGKLKAPGAKEEQAGIILMVDAFGNVTKTETEKTYKLIKGQAKVDTVTTHTEIDNIDGSHTIASHKGWSSQASVMKYDYDTDTGKLQNDGAKEEQHGHGIILMNDGFGNVTKTVTERTYRLINGQAKVDIVTTSTEIDNIDHSHTIASYEDWASQASVIHYTYNEQTGLLNGDGAEEDKHGIMLMDDGFGNVTKTITERIYKLIKGQAKVATVTTHTEIENIDGSYTVASHKHWASQASVTHYTYNEQTGLLNGDGAKEDQSGIMLTDDGFGNVTRTETKRIYRLINGQAKVETVTTYTEIDNIDGSHTIASHKGWSSQASVIHYTYDEQTGLLNENGAKEDQPGIILMDDRFGNVTKTETKRTYILINGQVKVNIVTTTTEIDNIDGSHTVAGHEDWTSQASRMHYVYDDVGNLKDQGAEEDQAGVILIDDGFGNITRTETKNTYRLIKGQAKVDTVTTYTEIDNIDGSHTIDSHEGWEAQASVIRYTYDEETGLLNRNGAEEEEDKHGIILMDDGFGKSPRTQR